MLSNTKIFFILLVITTNSLFSNISIPSYFKEIKRQKLPPSLLKGYVEKYHLKERASINIAKESLKISLKDYLLETEKLYKFSHDHSYKFLGFFNIKNYPSALIEISYTTNIHTYKILQALCETPDGIYVLSGSCFQNNYSFYYPRFIQSFLSFNL
ncbi:MAG TPA: hypothetical protein P5048_02970 [Chlamydiales bacterium]|nr:hypothetical protein [Chlamydiales bacterium]